MSLQLRVHTPQATRNKSKWESSRVLLRCSDPPRSPSTKGDSCDTVEVDGGSCRHTLPPEGQPWCKKHYRELKDLTARWKKVEKDAEIIEAFNPDTAKQKILKLRQAIDIRREIRDRFYPRGGDTADYLRWIEKLERDLQGLADSVLVSSLARQAMPVTPGVIDTPHPELVDTGRSGRIPILRSSPMSPRIPIDSLQSMGAVGDGTILVLKHFYTDICREGIRRLYWLVPDLNDGHRIRSPDLKSSSKRDGGTDIIRAWFRIMVLNDSEADALEHATKVSNIDDFLTGCHISQLEMYCDFFEKAWRPHAVQYLHAAICAQILAGGDTKTIGLLGGIIPSTTEGLRMTKPCWDILYRWFPTLLTPWTLASICSNFEDYTTICKLLMLGLYHEHWYDHDSLLTQCPIGVYLGFIPTTKGDFSSSNGMQQEEGTSTENEARNYISGQMAIGDPLTRSLLEELRKRKERLYLVVYEGTNADATVHPTEDDIFIFRQRSTGVHETIGEAKWNTSITLEDIKNDLRRRKTTMYDPIVVDSWQFIIIDRQTGLPFELSDIIQDALLMLVGDPTPKQVARRVVREVIPSPVQEIYLEELSIDSKPEIRFPAPPAIQYEGNRQRCYNPSPEVMVEHQQGTLTETRSRDANRFIRRVVEDMESAGIIRLAKEYEKPQTKPLIIQGTDGGLDLYFPYEYGGLAPNESTPSLTLPPKSCLLDFATEYKQKNSTAIFAKGSIMTHYCAWPMPAVKRMGRSRLNFATWEGHIYHWNAMPFDRPWSENAWQFYVQHYINSKYPSVMFYLTTFVICATDVDDAETTIERLLEDTESRGWRIILPSLRDWTRNVEDLKLDKLFNGVQPV